MIPNTLPTVRKRRPATLAVLLPIATALAAMPATAFAQAQGGPERQPADADFVMIGAGAMYTRSPYRGEDAEVMPIPIVIIRKGPFYVDTLEGGLQLDLFEESRVSISLQGFVAARTRAGSGRDKFTADAGGRISLTSALGVLSADYRHDITDEFNGGELTLRYEKDFGFGRFTLTPAVQANLLDREAADYVYGVTAADSEAFIADGLDIAAYTVPEKATNLGGDITLTYRMTDRLLLIGYMSGAYLDDPIRDNPGLEDEFEAQALIGLGYVF